MLPTIVRSVAVASLFSGESGASSARRSRRCRVPSAPSRPPTNTARRNHGRHCRRRPLRRPRRRPHRRRGRRRTAPLAPPLAPHKERVGPARGEPSAWCSALAPSREECARQGGFLFLVSADEFGSSGGY
jgi:hypothetical protein